MASLALTAVGTIIGGPVGGAIGGLIGGIIDKAVMQSLADGGPKLDDLKVMSADYGRSIPIVYGEIEVPGLLIWATDFQEIKKGGIGGAIAGKGSLYGGQTGFKYKIDLAVAFAQGPIFDLVQIEADKDKNKILYLNSKPNLKKKWYDSITLYKGSEDQSADPFMQSRLGIDKVPGYRGVAYVVIQGLRVEKFGNRIPSLTFTVKGITAGGTANLLDTKENQTFSPIDSAWPNPFAVFPSGNMLRVGKIDGKVAIRRTGSVGEFYGSKFNVETVHKTAFDATNYQTATTCFNYSNGLQTPILLNPAQSDAALLVTSPDLADSDYLLTPPPELMPSPYCVGSVYETGIASGITTIVVAGVNNNVPYVGQWNRTLITFEEYTGYAPVPGLGIIRAGAGSRVVLQKRTFPYDLKIVTILWDYVRLGKGNVSTVENVWDFQEAPVLAIEAMPRFSGKFFVQAGDYIHYVNLSESAPGVVAEKHKIGHDGFKIQCASTDGQSVLAWKAPNNFCIVKSSSDSIGPTFKPEIMQDVSISPTATATSYGTETFAINDGSKAVLLRAITNTDITVGRIVLDLCERTEKLNASDVDVSKLTKTVKGYAIVNPTSAKAAIEPLQAYAGFDFVESDGFLKGILRHDEPDVVIPREHLGVRGSNESPRRPIEETRAPDSEMIRELYVDYIDTDNDHATGTALSYRTATQSTAINKTQLAIAMTAEEAGVTAYNMLYEAWLNRITVTSSTFMRYLTLDPGDVVQLGESVVRIESIRYGRNVIEITGHPTMSRSDFSMSVQPNPVNVINVADVEDVKAVYLELPPLVDTIDSPVLYTALLGNENQSKNFDGASIWRYDEFQQIWSQIADVPYVATHGILNSPYNLYGNLSTDDAVASFDEKGTISVTLKSGELYSTTRNAVLASSVNAAILYDPQNPYNSEVIQFTTADLVAENTYNLSGILRGRRGTVPQNFPNGSIFILIESDTIVPITMNLRDLNQTIKLRSVNSGQTIDDAEATQVSVVYEARTLKPLAPVQLRSSYLENKTRNIRWKRRARINSQMLNYSEVALDELVEQYTVQIVSDTNLVLRSAVVTTNEFNYSYDDYIADYASNNSQQLYFQVAQFSNRAGNGSFARMPIKHLVEPIVVLASYTNVLASSTDVLTSF